jgi:DNA helicase-2/ATP-dependent DNA helicase PcrA
MVTKLSEILPCCILGDPLQAIFDFSDVPVDWNKDIYPNFQKIGELTTPWRWNISGAHEIGDWLKSVREKIECNEPINYPHPLPKGIRVHVMDSEDSLSRKQFNTCKYFALNDGESAIAIHKGEALYKNKSHQLAKQLSGNFSSIEEIEGVDLFRFINKISKNKKPSGQLKIAIEFAVKCMTGVKKELSAGTKRGEKISITKKTKNPDLGLAANAYLDEPFSDKLRTFFDLLKKTPGTGVFRRDLLNRLMQVLTIHSRSSSFNLEEAVNVYQKIFRHNGRPISYPRLIGTTLLIKGLEFDHTIVLDATSLSKKELYVALTRGSKTITIISTTPNLLPGNWSN